MCWIMTTCPMAHFRVMFASFSKRAWKVALKLFKRYTCNNNSFFFLIISPLYVQGLYRPTHIFWSIPMPRSLRIQRNVNQCLRSAVLLAKPTGRGKCNQKKRVWTPLMIAYFYVPVCETAMLPWIKLNQSLPATSAFQTSASVRSYKRLHPGL